MSDVITSRHDVRQGPREMVRELSNELGYDLNPEDIRLWLIRVDEVVGKGPFTSISHMIEVLTVKGWEFKFLRMEDGWEVRWLDHKKKWRKPHVHREAEQAHAMTLLKAYAKNCM